MMARIEAGERLAAINDRAVAAGNLKPADARRVTRRLDDVATGHRRRAARATPAVLAGIGIGMRAAAPAPAPEKGVGKGPGDV